MVLLTCFTIEEVDELRESTPRYKPNEIHRCEQPHEDGTHSQSPPTPCSFTPLTEGSSVDCSSISTSTSSSSRHLNLSVYDRLTMDSCRRQETKNELDTTRHGNHKRNHDYKRNNNKKPINIKKAYCEYLLGLKRAARPDIKKGGFQSKRKLSYNKDAIDDMLNRAEAAIEASRNNQIIKRTAGVVRHSGFQVRFNK